MKKNKLFSHSFISEILKVILLTIINFSLQSPLYTNIDIKKMLLGILVTIIAWGIYLLLYYILKIKRRPIQLSIELKNRLTQKSSTVITHFERKQRQDERTVYLIFKLKALDSIWTRMALRIIKNIDIDIILNPSERNEFVFCLDGRNISSNDKICINIKNDINNVLVSNGELYKEFNLLISENRDNNPQNNCKFTINSEVYIGNKYSFLTNLLLYSLENNEYKLHTVDYYI